MNKTTKNNAIHLKIAMNKPKSKSRKLSQHIDIKQDINVMSYNMYSV